MEKLLPKLVMLLLFISVSRLMAQNPGAFEIVERNSIENLEAYEIALETANLMPYRYLDSRKIIKFENGIEVELLSINEMESLGMKVGVLARFEDPVDHQTESVFVLKGSWIVEKVLPVNVQKSYRPKRN